MSNLIIPLQLIKTSVVVINVLSLWLVYLINIKKGSSKTSYLFNAMIALMLVWVNFALFARIMPTEQGITFIRLAWSITPLFFILIYFFIEELFNPKGKFTSFKKVLLGIGVINIPFVFSTPLAIKKISLIEKGVLNITYGGWQGLFFGQVLGYSFLIIYTLVKYLKKTDKPRKKAVIKYLLIGFSFFLLMNSVFNIIFPVFFKVFNLYAFGDYSTIVFLSFIVYAITKKNLFGIKVILSTMAVGFIAILLLVDLIAFTADILYLKIFKSIILASFLYFGKILIRSVSREIERREELERLSDQVVETNVKLKDANEKLKKLDKAKSEFMSIASHQLRTPLTAIKGYLSMITEGSYGKISEKTKEKLEQVLQSTERLIKLVNDLLNVSRIESGKIEMDFKKVNLVNFIEDSIQELKIVAENKDLYLNFNKGTEESLEVEMDQQRIRQVILNIIDNAIKYTEEGGITITTKKQSIESGKDSVLITIKDTGEGMDKKEINNIFDSFSRGSAGDLMHTEGAGLGLYVAKKFIDMHNGLIWIESKGKGTGTKFLIELSITQ